MDDVSDLASLDRFYLLLMAFFISCLLNINSARNKCFITMLGISGRFLEERMVFFLGHFQRSTVDSIS